ncbi:MAG: prolyl oligopeptidase family serine peptidase [Planctomycetales bacterium]|nr:prolyl oligopeptidase family serine peptidase [Planctomycetales bacterium]
MVLADGPQDNLPASVRPVPPPGIEVDSQTAQRLRDQVRQLDETLAGLGAISGPKISACSVLPRAVRMSLDTGMFYSENDLRAAQELLDMARTRIDLLRNGADTLEIMGITSEQSNTPKLMVGGFVSKIDQSVQPFGIVLPADFSVESSRPLRLDVWLHGRGEKSGEVAFLKQRQSQVGEYAPPGTVVLHPYGRYCNAFKFAGEIDVLEAIDYVSQILPIDTNRITIRGFSMGGAGCWQLAVHYPDIWSAANPGAGFSETREFLRVFQDEVFVPTPFQEKLLHWYDCPDWTNNLRSTPTVAYSGEIDRQKQAADVMAAAFQARHMNLTHIIGPQTAHKLHPESKVEIQELLDGYLSAGKPVCRKHVDLTTFSLRYHQLDWLSIEGLHHHWQESRVIGDLSLGKISLSTQGISRLRIQRGKADALVGQEELEIVIDNQHLTAPGSTKGADLWIGQDPSGTWSISAAAETTGLVKRPGLQGPIDDAFMDAFVFVPPIPGSGNGLVDSWIDREYQHATAEWIRHFRGNVVIASANSENLELLDKNLILFGTPRTNPLMAKILPLLPVAWTQQDIAIGSARGDAQSCVPILVYPNPLHPNRYIVINSGFTFREFAYLNNARQIPMLPDWAIVDISSGATTQLPGQIVAADFFDEHWMPN